MNTTLARATCAVVLMAGVVAAFAEDKPQIINIPLSRPGDPISLDISIVSADIQIIGESRDDAEFSVTVADGQRKIITPSGTKPVIAAGYTLEVDENDNNISLDTDWRANKVSIVARVPVRADLDLSTVNNSVIVVSDTIGNLQLSNVNGPITAHRVSGSVIAESVNNTIEVSLLQIDDVNATSLESINGDLKIVLPENSGLQLHLDSAKGEIYSDFEVDVQPTQPTIERNDKRGGVEVRIESVIIANINGGGPVIRLKTLNGDIHILKAD